MDRSDRRPAATALAALLRHHRALAGLTQQELARRIGYSRSSVANAECGDLRAVDFYARCDDALVTGGALAHARRALVPARPPEDRRPGGDDLAGVPPEEAIEHLRRHWHLLVRTDNLLGPRAALPAALDLLATIAALRPGAGGPVRTALRCLSARYAVTASWLSEDAGQPADAALWAARALEWAHESDDRASLAWALHRHSRLRAAEGDAERALSLARAALRAGTDAGRPLAAALRVQYACAFALAGDRRRCGAQLTRAALVAELRETAGDGRTGYGGHCTRAWVLAARGECALVLGTPADAVRPLRTASALLAPAYRRNRGLVVGRLAEACTRLGRTDEARRAEAECRAIGEATGSASVLTLLARRPDSAA